MEAGPSLTMSCRGEPGRSELHLSEGNGGVFTFPVYPDYSLEQKQKKNIYHIWPVCLITKDKNI